MKLSFSLVLLAAAVGIQAAATPKAASKCIAGSSGKENGDGYNGYCCKYDDDCFESCVKGVCNGPTNTKTATKTTTAAPTSSGTPGACVAGSAGLGNGDGYNGYCCKSSNDCFESCKSGVCNGPTNTKTVTKTTTAAPTSSGTPGACVAGSAGLGNGDGYNGYCCKSSNDCFESCKSGVCNGPTNTKTATKTTTAAPTSSGTPGACVAGSAGLGNGDGYNGYCCKSSDDCFESCKSGVCNGPTNTKTATKTATKTTTAAPTSSGTPGACVAGSAGLGNGDGYNGYCCKSSDDCFESCKSGVCNGPTNTKTTAPTSTPTDTDKACKAGYKGLGNGEGPTNACCSDSDDCQESCIDGKCKKA